jgi:gas vesicle protein
MKDATKVTLSFVAGAAAGIGLGLLFAPKTGDETREDVKKWLGEKKEQSKELLEKSKDEFGHKKEQFAAAVSAGKKAYVETPRNHKEAVGV